MHGYHEHTYLKRNSQLSRHKRNSTILILEIKEHLRKPLLSNHMRYVEWILMCLVIAHVIHESSFDSS